MIANASVIARMRGLVLELIYDNWRKQQSRYDDLMLFTLLGDLKYDVSRNDVVTELQYLRSAGYLKFHQERNEYTGQMSMREIELTPQGCNLVEKFTTDPAVRIFR